MNVEQWIIVRLLNHHYLWLLILSNGIRIKDTHLEERSNVSFSEKSRCAIFVLTSEFRSERTFQTRPGAQQNLMKTRYLEAATDVNKNNDKPCWFSQSIFLP